MVGIPGNLLWLAAVDLPVLAAIHCCGYVVSPLQRCIAVPLSVQAQREKAFRLVIMSATLQAERF